MGQPFQADAADALLDSERRLRLAVEAGGVGIWDWNLVTNEIVWSEEAKAIAGLPRDQPLTFEQVRKTTHPDDLPRTSAMAQRALDPNERLREAYEYRVVRPDGEIRWVAAKGEAVFASDEDGVRAVRYIGTIRDITEWKRADRAIRESEARLRVAIDAARLGIWDYDATTDRLNGSPELNRVLGLSPDEVVDRALMRARYYPGDERTVQDAGAAALKAGETHFTAEFRFYWPDRSLHWLLLRGEIRFQGETPVGAVGVVMDITDRKLAEERQAFLMRELVHRVRNTLASVRAIAGSTLRHSQNLKDAETALSARLAALADVHALLTSSQQRADLGEIARAVVEPYRSRPDRIHIAGPALLLDERDSLGVAMALHELATNATKYGALSRPEGHVELTWELTPDSTGKRLELRWREQGGPPVEPPKRRGFGMRLIEQALAGKSQSRVELDFSGLGVVCTMAATIDRPA